MNQAHAPSPAQLDKLCEKYVQIETKIAGLEGELKIRGAEILALVHRWGRVPADAEKSIRLEGRRFQATSIGGSTTEIDERGVLQFKLALIKVRCGNLFRRFFVTSTKYTVSPEAKALLADPPARLPKNLANLFHAAMSISPKKPRLDVKPIVAKKASAK